MDTSENATLDPAVFDRLRRIGGEPLVKRMIETFMGYAPGQLDIIVRATRAADPTSVGDAAHSMKSSAGNIGAMELFRLSLAVEQAGRAGDMENLPALVAELAVTFDTVTDHLGALSEEEGA